MTFPEKFRTEHPPVDAVRDQTRDPILDAICRTATALFGVRYASISRLDPVCQFYLGREGLEASSTPRDIAFCAFTVLGTRHEPFIVLDTHRDPLFATNPLVTGAPHLRFYAGIPIWLADGVNEATVCIADTAPRKAFSDEDRRRLTDLAVFVEASLRGRIAQQEAERARERVEGAYAALRIETAQRAEAEALAARQRVTLQESQDAERMAEETAGFGRWSVDLVAETVIWSKGMARVFGREDLAERTISLKQHVACYHPDERASVRAAFRCTARSKASEEGGAFTRRGRIVRPDSAVREIVVHGRLICDAAGVVVATRGITLDVTELSRSERDLRASDTLLRTTLEHMDQGLIMLDGELRVRVSNRRAQILLDLPDGALDEGVPFAEIYRVLVDRGDFDLLPRGERADLDQFRLDLLPHSITWTRADSSTLEVRHTPLPDGGRIFTFTDISARCAAEVAVQESERRFRLLAENANDIIVLGALDMSRLYVSPAVRTVLGYEPEEFLGRTPIEFGHPDDAHIFADTWSKLLRGQDDTVVACVRYRHKAGHYVWIESSIRLTRDAVDGSAIGYVASLRDVTARRAAEEKIRHTALHDGLTGLPNRTLFRDRLDQAVVHASRSGGSFAVLACDLDRFKAVNDSFGHPAGDALLRVVAERMRAVLRPYDTVARLGGDEFAIVLTYLDEPCSAGFLAERLIEAVSHPVSLDGHMVEVGVSIGLTIASGQGASADELFKRADIALYEAKAGGRNTYREFCPDVGARIATRGQLGLDMKEAIRRGEFRLVYQPVVEAATGAVVGFEALMRWRHPVRGEISPGEFIPVAEETGLIVPLGVWALHEACREAMNWPAHVRVAVNVSAVQLRREGLEASVIAALTASGLPAARLILEVTESVLMQDADATLACLHRLRGLGVRIALDDFGTGYSSLSYLRSFPFDKIKIDRAFVRDIADPDAAAIVRAVVGIGERLGMGIVAEGVETAEQLDLVRREGCVEIQGFLFSRPLPSHKARLYVVAARKDAA